MTSVTQLKRSSPEAEGIPSSAVLDFIRAVEKHDHPLDAVHGFMLLRHGKVAAEGWWTPYGPHSPHSQYSLSKSFTSTGIALAVDQGLLTVDDPVLKFFPNDAPSNPSENLKAMRVRHLLSMNTGHDEDTTARVFRDLNRVSLFGSGARHQESTTGQVSRGEEDNWPRTFLSLPVEHQPGTWFVYNTAATYMLSAIITKLTSESLLDYLRPRLFDPLGIENPTWETDPRGVSIGGSGLHIRTEDMARFGQMYLQKGMWDGKRILRPEWVAEATSAHADNSNTQTNPDWTVGYGYQFWRCRHGCYRGDGAFGQYCIVMPEQDALLAIIGGVRDMQAVLDNVWEHLLPAMRPEALPAKPEAYRECCDKLEVLSLPLPKGQPSSPKAEQWSGKTYQLESNDLKLESVAIKFGDERSTLIVRDERGQHPMEVGYAKWLKWTTDMRGHGEEPVAACGAWTAEDTYEVRVCYYEAVFCPVFRFRYTSGELQLEVEPNVSWDQTTVTTIIGRIAASIAPQGSASPQFSGPGAERFDE
jgi:CubicO group peptidase (beta-lactamase class C family)